MSVGLIDLDIVVYKVASACENTYWIYKGREYESKVELNLLLKSDGVEREHEASVVTKKTRPEDWESCRKSLILYTEGLLDRFEEYKGFLSGRSNFRYRAATILPYKGNRDTFGKPYHYDSCRQYLVDAYGAALSVGYEADDAIGLASGEGTIVVSNDKDLNCIPGPHYNWDKDLEYDVDELDSYRHFFKQLLTGDPTDNILGLFGVGAKSAHLSAIESAVTVDTMLHIVSEEYRKRFGSYGPAFMEENAKLLWILQKRENPVVAGAYWE